MESTTKSLNYWQVSNKITSANFTDYCWLTEVMRNTRWHYLGGRQGIHSAIILHAWIKPLCSISECTVCTRMQGKVFSLNVVLKYVGHFKFVYEVPNQTASKRTVLNQTMRSQTKAWTAKSCEISALLIYYATYSSNSLPAFRDNLLVLSSRVKKPKSENITSLKLTNTIFFYGTLSIT